MKKFKITMLATSLKEVFLNAKNEEDAFKKLEKMYFDKEEINFTDDDIIEINNSCEEVKSERRSKLNISPIYDENGKILNESEDKLDLIYDKYDELSDEFYETFGFELEDFLKEFLKMLKQEKYKDLVDNLDEIDLLDEGISD